jgi:hypothetical protein
MFDRSDRMASLGQQTPFQQLQLLNIARTLVPSGCARDTVHILLAALENPGTTGPAGELIGGLDAVRRGQLQTALKVAIDLNREQLAYGESDRPTERLRQCEEQWQRQVLQQPGVGLTSALVLSIIVGNDPVVQSILRTCGIEPNGWYQALQQRSAIPELPYPVQTSPLPPAGQWTLQRATDKALELAKPIEPSPSREFRLRHPVATEHLLNSLGPRVPCL